MIIIPSSTAEEVAGLKMSTSNELIGQVPTITSAGISEVPANISDPDHSLNYTSGTSLDAFEVSYGAQTGISYVAVSGQTSATLNPSIVRLYDGLELLGTATLRRNNNLMFTFSLRLFTDLIIKFETQPSTFQTTVSYIAAGTHMTIPSGEQAGYKRQWLNRHLTQRTTTNLQVGPVSSTTQSKSLKASLSFPNTPVFLSQNEWQDFIDFSFEQPFFIKEVTNKPESSYICFDPQYSISAHSQTRALDVLKLSFTLFNGL